MSKDSRPPPECRFKEVTGQLCDLLWSIVSKQQTPIVSPLIITIAKLYLLSFNDDTLINNYITYSNEHWTAIKNGDTKYFIENKRSLFGEIPSVDQSSAPDLFSQFLADPKISKDVIDSIWTFQRTLVRIAINYIHNRRKPHLIDGHPCYREDYFNNINLIEMAKLFNVDIVFT